ncbi:flagellar assembly protein FliW [Opitutales bacterium]|jgi:flagellar assembly factor FliW|nr:flagellar assembly protein FliW [Opitutales bacterium]MDG1173861.1 flagellar assembly protein FliW [Opitutales bacterium]
MKLKIGEESLHGEKSAQHSHMIDVSGGLFGFPDIKEMELFYDQEELPFMWLREGGQEGLAFIVIEPGGIIPDYTVEISDNDVDYLKVTGADDTMILNIITLPSEGNSKISVNLVGPVIVNRNTLVAKQCIINNHEKYSARHILDLADSGE